jgi:hypothetical protein
MRVLSLLIFCFFFYQMAGAQQALSQVESKLIQLYQEVKKQETFDEKISSNDQFRAQFKTVLQNKESFVFPFDSLKMQKGIKEITSSDDKVRLFTWVINNSFDGTYQYFGFIVRKESGKINTVHELKDNEDPMNQRVSKVIDPANWYGALYIDVIVRKIGSKTYYTLLGWDGNNPSSNIRIIDALVFSGKSVKIGAPIFKNQKEKLNRVYFEYSESALMNMTYEAKYKRIMFDHLIPEAPNLKGIYSFYIPDFSYDSYSWKSDGWHLMEDVIGVNPEGDKNLTIMTQDRKGKLKKRRVKNKWENPGEEMDESNEFKHVARTPESERQVETPDRVKQKKYKSSKKNNPLLPESIYGKKKKKRKRGNKR